MRPQTVTVTSANSPVYIPVDWSGGPIGISAFPSGSGDYDVAYTLEQPADYDFSAVTDWTDITSMSAATAAATAELGPTTCIRITLNSGTSVKCNIVQNLP